MAPLPNAVAIPTRALPAEAAGTENTPLEYVSWPLYSCTTFAAGAALPRESQLFGFTIGDNVIGGVAGVVATLMHTNMEVPRSVPRPRTFTVTGLRILVPPLALGVNPALADDTVGTAPENNDQVDDLVRIAFSTHIEFKIGNKNYAEAPIWMLPSQSGLGGVATTSVNANAGQVWQTRVALHTAGVGYRFKTGRKPVLWHSQPFTFGVFCVWPTTPTIIDDKTLYAILDGVLGREIQ